MSEDIPNTKERLLDAAETLFASRGFEAVSIRELAAAADVNVAAVNYHFHGKENLFEEVCLRRFARQRDSTLQALEELRASSGGRPDLESVIGTLVRQHLEGSLASPGGAGFLMAVTREMHTPCPRPDRGMFRRMIRPMFEGFSATLQAAEPRLDPEQRTWVIASIVAQIHHFIMRWMRKEFLDAECEDHALMLEIFPVLDSPLETYIDQVTRHVTRFSAAAVRGLLEEADQ